VRVRLVALLAVGAIVLTGCGGGGGTVSSQSQALGSIDINAQPRDNVRDGGNLRLPMSLFPSNFNINEVDGSNVDMGNIVGAILPSMFVGTADGGSRVNTDYLSSAVVTSTSPQVVTYTINPKAAWTDGTPITWRDFQAYWQAQNGTNPAYQVAGTTGYDSIGSVARGIDDKQVVVTFAKPYGEWKNLFTPLEPTSLTSTPAAFNTGWKTSIPVTAGPFTVQSIDQTSQTITLARDPKWWGTPAKLDRIIFRVYDSAAEADALANNELDYYEIGGNLDLFRRAQRTPGGVVRNAPSRQSFNVTFNGGTGSPLANLPLRQAIAQGINRQEIVRQIIGQIVPNAQPDGSHLYAPGSKEYRDNSGVLPYDPAHAQQTLDSLGWVRQGTGPTATRVKDGKPLSLRLVYGQDPAVQDLAVTVQNELAQIGVTVVLNGVDGNQFFPTYITPGNFDMALFGWQSTSSPFSSSFGIYGLPLGSNVRQNYGRIGSPEIDKLFAQGTAELDDTKRAAIGDQVDRLIWQEAHSVILYPRPGAVAVRSNLANFGAFGFADWDYINAGFVK
jgi:peptide/nickel transport system substrate-binding protein